MWRRRLPEDTSDDAALVERLRSASLSLQPGRVDEGRERLLRAVAEQRAASRPSKERTTVFNVVLGKKRLAFVAAGVLAVGAAGAVGASGGVSGAAGNVNDVLAALHVTDKAPDVADGHIDAIEQQGGAEDPSGASADENANENASEGADNADDGINNGNASDTGLDHAADNAFEGSGNADGASDGINNGNASDTGLDHAADNAFEGSGNAHGAPDVVGASLPDLPDAADDAMADVDPGVPGHRPVDGHADPPDQAGDPPVPAR